MAFTSKQAQNLLACTSDFAEHDPRYGRDSMHGTPGTLVNAEDFGNAVGLPGFAKALEFMHRRYGEMIDSLEKGEVKSGYAARSTNRDLPWYKAFSTALNGSPYREEPASYKDSALPKPIYKGWAAFGAAKGDHAEPAHALLAAYRATKKHKDTDIRSDFAKELFAGYFVNALVQQDIANAVSMGVLPKGDKADARSIAVPFVEIDRAELERVASQQTPTLTTHR